MDTVVHILGTLCAFLITGATLVWGYVFWRYLRLDRKVEQVKVTIPSFKDEADKLSLDIVSKHNKLRELWAIYREGRFTDYGEVNREMLLDCLNSINLWAYSADIQLGYLEHAKVPTLEIRVRLARILKDFYQAKDELLDQEDPMTKKALSVWVKIEAEFGAYGPRKD